MPDKAGNFKGVSLSGVSNPWLDSLTTCQVCGAQEPAPHLATVSPPYRDERGVLRCDELHTPSPFAP